MIGARRSRICAIVAFGCAVACGGDDDAWSPATVRDSAGITIVENTGNVPPSHLWTLAEPAMATIGADDGDDPGGLFRVSGALRLPDGRIAVANAGSSELILFTASGAFLARTGGQGSGPGEFRHMSRLLLLPPDSPLVWDGRLERMSVLDRDGRFARSFRFDLSIDPILQPIAVLPDRGFLALKTSHMVSLPNDGVNVDSALILRFDASGAFVDSVGRFAQNQRFVMRSGDLRTTLGVPFAPIGQLAVHDDRLCYATGDLYEITCSRLDSSDRQIIRLDHAPAPITEDMVDRYFAAQMSADDPNRRSAVRRLREALPIPAQLPAIADIEIAGDGNLWVRDYVDVTDSTAAHTWRVFDAAGALQGVVTMPGRFTALEIGADAVLGLRLDEYDVEHIELYCVSRDAGGCAGS